MIALKKNFKILISNCTHNIELYPILFFHEKKVNLSPFGAMNKD